MDMQRGILYAALFLVCSLLWSDWEREHPGTPSISTTIEQAISTTKTPSAASNSVSSVTRQNFDTATLSESKQLIHIYTDVLDISLDPKTGSFVDVKLPHYPESQGKETPFTLMSSKEGSIYIARSGLNAGNNTTPIIFQNYQKEYRLKSSDNQLVVELYGRDKTGTPVTQTITVNRGSYLIQLDYKIRNISSQPWKGNFYAEFIREKPNTSNSSVFHINPYVGAAISSPQERYQKLSFDHLNDQNLNRDIKDGWMVFQQHYFLSALVPDPTQTWHYTSSHQNDIYTLRLSGDVEVPANETKTVTTKLYAGPAIAALLKNVSPGLDLTIDYGIFWMIGVAIFWLLGHLNTIVHNWGVSIILVTVCIKLLFYHLSAKSYRSMAGMRQLQPRIMALREKFGDDRQKLGQATMELYKKEKINPLGGCLPILVQIPVFLALYWVLLESVELRQAPFFGWIHDLSLSDPYYVLPVVMGITMLIQQKLSPPPPDPMQAKVMMFLPVIFTVFFLNFPAGLVLYWLVNNTLSILQQWYVTKQVEKAEKNKKHKR